jgi:membrane-associated phospholipid phosphatase
MLFPRTASLRDLVQRRGRGAVAMCALASLAVSTLAPRVARAGCIEHPLTDVGPRMARLAEPVNLVLVGTAVASPFALAPTGVDWSIRSFVQGDLGGRYDAEQTSILVPFALVSALATGWSVAAIAGDCPSSRVAGRALQATLIAGLLQATVKLAVGRTYPATEPARRFVDDGRAYEAKPFETLGAWPSGHAATMFAFAAAIRTSLPRRAGAFRYAGYGLAAAVSAGMLYGDHHWASDVVSGALLGEAIGRSAGGGAGQEARMHLVPTGTGLAIAGSF